MLKYAILGLLKIRDMSGYDIDKTLQISIKNFWNINQSHIYQELKKLEKQKFIESKKVVQENKPNKKIFKITELGCQEFKNFFVLVDENLDGFLDIKALFLTRVFYASFSNDDDNIDFLKKLKKHIQWRIEHLHKTKEITIKNTVETPNHKRNTFYWHNTLDCGFYVYEAIIKWIDDTIKKIKKEL